VVYQNSIHVHIKLCKTAQTPGYAFQVGVLRKLASNLSACRSSRLDFVLLVAEALGLIPSTTLAGPWKTDEASLSLLKPLVICLVAWQLLYGGAMPLRIVIFLGALSHSFYQKK